MGKSEVLMDSLKIFSIAVLMLLIFAGGKFEYEWQPWIKCHVTKLPTISYVVLP